MKRRFITLLTGIMAVFAFIPMSVSANCVALDGTIYGCGAVVTKSCTLTANMNCNTRHGLIIGAAGITIDGDGFTLDGSSLAMTSRHCAVNVAPEDDADRLWCVGHPCRTADVTPADSDPLTFNGCLDSGVINAVTTLGGGVTGAQMCEGGFDNVTVKNLEITGFCDGIFMSGDCECNVVANGRTECAVSPAGTSEYRLTEIVIEGNYIHDNGNSDCGTYQEAAGGDGGDWTRRYYNDAIFLTQVGIDGDTAGNPPACEEYTMDGVAYPDLITNGLALPATRNRVTMNTIHEQHGCACVSCPGGSGININGGLEEFDENDNFTGTWTGCDEIIKNRVRGCDVSGITYHHGLKYTRIHGNDVTRNKFGGIANGCAWAGDHYIYDNVAKQNYGAGIAVNATAKIKNNIVTHTRPAVGEVAELYMGVVSGGHGIFAGEAGSELARNMSYANAGTDIRAMDVAGTDTHDNMCQPNSADPMCDCGTIMPWICNVCKHDVNNGPLGDGMVSYDSDGNGFLGTVYGYNWGMPFMPKCWLINGQ